MSGADTRGAIEEHARFGGRAAEPIDRLLRDAASAYADTERAEALLREAQALDPQDSVGASVIRTLAAAAA